MKERLQAWTLRIVDCAVAEPHRLHAEPEVGMPRRIVDCREMPSDANCTLTISGEEEEVVRAAAMHAVDVHGHVDGAELREQLRSILKAE